MRHLQRLLIALLLEALAQLPVELGILLPHLARRVFCPLNEIRFSPVEMVKTSRDFARKLESRLTAARVGFFLDRHREELMVEDEHLEAFRELAPTAPSYLDSKREPGTLVSDWNLIVPDRVLGREWMEAG